MSALQQQIKQQREHAASGQFMHIKTSHKIIITLEFIYCERGGAACYNPMLLCVCAH